MRSTTETGGRRRGIGALLAAIAALCALWIAACGSSDSDDGSSPEASGEIDWPLFGRTPVRNQFLGGKHLDPPFNEVWSYDDATLLEFPPALVDGVLYVADKAGDIRALRASDGSTLWHRQGTGTNEGAPADTTGATFSKGTVYVALEDGRVVALEPKTGDIGWTRVLPSRLESSPLVIGDTLFLGSDKGVVYALDSANGHTRWTYDASSQPVKTSPSYRDGVVYFADYGGVVHAVRASDGKKVWETATDQLPPGGSGGFYSSPALAAGKLFIGRDDGAVFALDLRTGARVWSKATGGAVIGSPALAKVAGTPLTAYIGSYDRYLYAFDAADGDVRWRYDVKGPIPGTPTVIGTTVYTSSFKTQEMVGVSAKSGREVFHFAAPGYTPMISDGQRLFLIGYESVRALEPK